MNKDGLKRLSAIQPVKKSFEQKAMINLVQASTAIPENKISTTDLVASMMHKLSSELINTIWTLGVDDRYSAMDNYADFLNGAPMNMTTSTTEMGVDATRKWAGEGFTRPWPDVIEMSPEVKRRVDELWKKAKIL